MTNGEWKKFISDPGYDDPRVWPGGSVVPKDQNPYWNDAQNHGGGTPDTDNYPALSVNWDSAVAYCTWLSAKTGKKYGYRPKPNGKRRRVAPTNGDILGETRS